MTTQPATTLQPMHVIAYAPDRFEEKTLHKPEEIRPYLKDWPMTWLNIDGPIPPHMVDQFSRIFDMHPLAIEDVMYVQERSKVESYGAHVFLVARMISPGETLNIEQMSAYIGSNFVVTFQEEAGGDYLEPVRERIRRNLDKIRHSGAGYLVYALLDTIVDAYFPILERYGETLEDIEARISLTPKRSLINEVHMIKRDMLRIRRAVWPLRDMLHTLLHDHETFAPQELNVYLRDCYDHVLRVIDLIEVERELCSDLMDFYLSNVGNRTNEVMKILAIISTIFMPLTFVAGVYGMNFNPDASPLNMPELNWYYGYPFALGMMLVFVMILLIWFRYRNWI